MILFPNFLGVRSLPFLLLFLVPSFPSAQTVTTHAGDGNYGYLGDDGPATLGQLGAPDGVALDSQGNLYIAEAGNLVIRRVDAVTGNLSTVAGSATPGYTGDGGPATQASLFYPTDIALDSQDNLYISDFYNSVVRRVDAATGIITTFAGDGTFGYGGDGMPATQASLNGPEGLAFDAQDNLYIADYDNHRVRRVDAVTGVMTTYAGNGTLGYSGDGMPATQASLSRVLRLGFDGGGNLLISDPDVFVVRRVDAATTVISTFAGSGAQGAGGDGGPATLAAFDGDDLDLAVDCAGNVFVGDDYNRVIRRIDAVTGVITRAAGTGIQGYSGDGGPPLAAQFSEPEALVMDRQGDLYMVDYLDNVVRRIGSLGVACTPTPTPAPSPPSCGEDPTAYTYPNPVRGNSLTLVVGLCEAAPAEVGIYNPSSSLVARHAFQGSPGVNPVQLDVSKFAHGIYYGVVRAKGPSGERSSTVFKFAVIR